MSTLPLPVPLLHVSLLPLSMNKWYSQCLNHYQFFTYRGLCIFIIFGTCPKFQGKEGSAVSRTVKLPHTSCRKEEDKQQVRRSVVHVDAVEGKGVEKIYGYHGKGVCCGDRKGPTRWKDLAASSFRDQTAG